MTRTSPALAGRRSTRRVTDPAPLATAKALRRLSCGCLAVLSVAWAHPSLADDRAPVRAAVADFDNFDTSGESSDRTRAHAARVGAFAGILDDHLAAEGEFEIAQLVCPQSPCSPTAMPPAKFLQAARDSGARLVVYGGIQKMSTLVQIGFVQAIDLETDELVFNQAITFRGDTDEAYRKAASFVAGYLKDVRLDP